MQEIWERIKRGVSEEELGSKKYGNYQKYQNAFDKLMDISDKSKKILCYFDKIIIILSNLGTRTPRKIRQLGMQGLFLLLLDLTRVKEIK